MINWTLSDNMVRTSVEVGVAYSSPTREVDRLVQRVLAEHGKILKQPAPTVLFTEFGDNALHFRAPVHYGLPAHGGQGLKVARHVTDGPAADIETTDLAPDPDEVRRLVDFVRDHLVVTDVELVETERCKRGARSDAARREDRPAHGSLPLRPPLRRPAAPHRVPGELSWMPTPERRLTAGTGHLGG